MKMCVFLGCGMFQNLVAPFVFGWFLDWFLLHKFKKFHITANGYWRWDAFPPLHSTPLHSSPGSPSPPPDPSVSSANFSAGWKWCWWWFCGCCRCWWGGNEIFAGGPNKLTILWGPLLSIWEVARSQLEHVSFGLLDGLADHYDDHDEDGQQDEDAAYGHGHHGAVTHAGLFFFSS